MNLDTHRVSKIDVLLVLENWRVKTILGTQCLVFTRLSFHNEVFNTMVCSSKELGTIFLVIHKWPHRSYGVIFPLRNGSKKKSLFFNTMVCSSKELGTRISGNAWPFP